MVRNRGSLNTSDAQQAGRDTKHHDDFAHCDDNSFFADENNLS
jgi:hypothetical protein